MSYPFVPQVGAVFSADIAVPQHEREVRFYARVLCTGSNPLWREDLMNNLGLPIIGLGAQSPDYAGLPLQWMPHIQVNDVATSVKQALQLGGREIMHARSDDGTSQWAVLADPNGAAFGVIPVIAKEHVPAVATGENEAIGRIAWLDLTVPDAVSTRDFYRRVVGWSVEDVAMEDEAGSYMDYTMLAEDGSAAAGICHARGTNAGLPPVWMIYLPVGDLVESLRRVEEGQGRVLKAVKGEGGTYVYAAVQDPVGVHFGLIQAP